MTSGASTIYARAADDAARYPRFSDAEFQRRYDLTRAFLSEHGLDAVVVFGNGASGRAGQADIGWLSNFMGFRENYALFPLRGDPVMFVRSINHLPLAQVISVFDDVRSGDEDGVIGAEIERRGLRSVGVVGFMPYQHHAAMAAKAPRATFTDVTGGFRRLRLVKSAEELDWLRRGATFIDAALAALEREARPGMHEYELGEVIEHAYLRDGGETQFYYLGSTSMTNPDRCVPAQLLSSRLLEAGDIFFTEMSVGYGGYAGQGLRSYTVAADPTPLVRDLHDVAEHVYAEVAAVLKPGATTEDVLNVADQIDRHGYTTVDGLLHGYGVGLLAPSFEPRQYVFQREADAWEFRLNETVVIQPNITTKDMRLGVQMGDLCVITPNGAESLHTYPRRLARCG